MPRIIESLEAVNGSDMRPDFPAETLDSEPEALGAGVWAPGHDNW